MYAFLKINKAVEADAAVRWNIYWRRRRRMMKLLFLCVSVHGGFNGSIRNCWKSHCCVCLCVCVHYTQFWFLLFNAGLSKSNKCMWWNCISWGRRCVGGTSSQLLVFVSQQWRNDHKHKKRESDGALHHMTWPPPENSRWWPHGAECRKIEVIAHMHILICHLYLD